eukprot:scaffold131173_cov66-Phaeocystis_antarctica.AAC.2
MRASCARASASACLTRPGVTSGSVRAAALPKMRASCSRAAPSPPASSPPPPPPPPPPPVAVVTRVTASSVALVTTPSAPVTARTREVTASSKLRLLGAELARLLGATAVG